MASAPTPKRKAVCSNHIGDASAKKQARGYEPSGCFFICKRRLAHTSLAPAWGEAFCAKALQFLRQGGKVAAGIIPARSQCCQCQQQKHHQCLAQPAALRARRRGRCRREGGRGQGCIRYGFAVGLPACAPCLRQTAGGAAQQIQQPQTGVLVRRYTPPASSPFCRPPAASGFGAVPHSPPSARHRSASA